MTSQPDYYAALRVKPDASQQEISRAYRALMRTHHPDRHPGPEGQQPVRPGRQHHQDHAGALGKRAVSMNPKTTAITARRRTNQ